MGKRGDAPVSVPEIRPAATIMVVRDDPGGRLQVLMVRRNLSSDFVGGAYVFPGGGLDPSDHDAAWPQRCPGRSVSAADVRLGVAGGALAYWVAVVRETFEETGVLLARNVGGQTISFDDPAVAARFSTWRAELNAKERSFLEICEAEDLSLAVESIEYFAHWITPEGAPRRYDTRFFVALAPEGQTAENDNGELIDEVWLAPSEALRRHRDGEIEIIFPTIRNLQAIDRFANAADLMAAASANQSIADIVPRVVRDGNGIRIALPGDPDYEIPVDDIGGRANFNEAVRAISIAANTELAPPD